MAHRGFAQWLAAAAIVALSCDLLNFIPAPREIVPTPVPGVVQTIVVMTAGAAQSQTAVRITPSSTPTSTAAPTHTVTSTPTFTPTFFFVLQTPTPIPTMTSFNSGTATEGGSSGGFGCALVSQSPADGLHYASKENFKVTWKLKNTGTRTWAADDVDFEYFSGTKMYKQHLYDVNVDVAAGATVTFIVPEVAPKNSGTYTTVWALTRGNLDFCHVDLTIVVP
jgi:hypothetical protein